MYSRTPPQSSPYSGPMVIRRRVGTPSTVSSRGSPMSISPATLRMLSPIIQAATGMLPPPAQAALNVGRYLGGQLVRAVRGRTGQNQNQNRRVAQKGRVFTPGRFAGKFKKSRRKITSWNKYSNIGIVDTVEVNGQVADPDCVYISHLSIDGFKCIEIMILALMRKLFTKGGLMVTNADELLPNKDFNLPADIKIELTSINLKTGVESITVTHQTIATSTLRTVAAAFFPVFAEYSAGFTTVPGAGSASNDVKPHRLLLYSQDFNVTLGFSFKCELRLDDLIVHVCGESDLKIQNRTLAANNSADAEDITSNPIVGRLYRFVNIPRTRDRSAFLLNTIPVNNGVQLARAAQFTGNTAWREPPMPNMFSNCRGSSVIRLEPGAIKKTKIYDKKSGRFLRILQLMRVQYGTGTQFNTQYTPFKSEIVALEDVINVNAANNITCAYEANKRIGVYFTVRKEPLGVQTFSAVTSNNLPA